MINHIWGQKQHTLQVNGHAWFHFHGICWFARNEKHTENSKWKYMSPPRIKPATYIAFKPDALDRLAIVTDVLLSSKLATEKSGCGPT